MSNKDMEPTAGRIPPIMSQKSIRDNIVHKFISEEVQIEVHAYKPESRGISLGPPPKAVSAIKLPPCRGTIERDYPDLAASFRNLATKLESPGKELFNESDLKSVSLTHEEAKVLQTIMKNLESSAKKGCDERAQG